MAYARPPFVLTLQMRLIRILAGLGRLCAKPLCQITICNAALLQSVIRPGHAPAAYPVCTFPLPAPLDRAGDERSEGWSILGVEDKK